MEENSVLAQSAYTFNNNNRDVEATEQEIRDYGLEGYKIDEELSDNNSLVLFNEQGQEVTLSVRGTKPSMVKDLIADAEILMGGETNTKRFTGEYEKMDKIIAKYPGKKIKAVGHSLGANISYKLGRDYNIEGHHFNTGASLREARDNLKSIVYCGEKCEALEKQYFYTTNVDPISAMMIHPIVDRWGLQNVTYQHRPGLDLLGHSLDHFLPVKKGQIENEIVTFTTPYDMYKDIEKRGFIKMEAIPRKQAPNPVSRDYCRDNPKDSKCLIYRNR